MPCKSQRLLALVIPTLIALLSVYWYRKRRKLNIIKSSQFLLNTSSKEAVDNSAHCSSLADANTSSNYANSSLVVLDDAKPVNSLSSSCNGTMNETKSLSTHNETNFCSNHSSYTTQNDNVVDKLSALSLSNGKFENTTQLSEVSLSSEINDSNCFSTTNVIEDPAPQHFGIKLCLASEPLCDDELSKSTEVEPCLQDPGSPLFVSSTISKGEEEFKNNQKESVESVEDLAYATGTSSPNTADKDSPLSFGSPVVQNNEAASTSNVSLNEFISMSLGEKHQVLGDNNTVGSCLSVDSGIGDRTVSCGSAEGNDVMTSLNSLPFSTDATFYEQQLVQLVEDSDETNTRSSELLPCQKDKFCGNSSQSSSSSNLFNGQLQVLDSKMRENLPIHYVYEFELPQQLCGKLIGRQGKTVKFIKERTNASVCIQNHPYDPQLKLAVVEGHRSDVRHALDIIRKKFPPAVFPSVTLIQTNASSNTLPLPMSESLQLQLPEGSSCDVILSSMVNAGHFFLQQPTHPSYPSLSTLDQCMMTCYSHAETPQLPQPVEAGVICAASVMGGWYRAQVMSIFDSGNEVEVKFVDYGGYTQVQTSSLRQIRSDFMTFPFQATECYLANVQPLDKDVGWTPEACAAFEELAQGQILQTMLVDYHEDGTPFVHLYRVQGISSTFINLELVQRGFAKWLEHR